jgi:dTDP-glucose 4,6-dehydratase
MTRLLVTGGAGFIGSSFVRHVLESRPADHVIVLDALTYAGRLTNLTDDLFSSGRLDFWQGDVTNSEIVARLTRDVDAVVHFAAETHVARSIYANRSFFETDVLGTQVIANAVLESKVQRLVHISTSEVYGSAETAPMDENHPLNPRTPYASAKTGADRLVYSYAASYDLPAIIIRPFNTYGPRQHLEKVVPRFVTSALLDEPLVVHGDGRNTRDWVNVQDLCRAVAAALDVDQAQLDGQAVNVGTGVETSIGDIAAIVLQELGKPASMLTYF